MKCVTRIYYVWLDSFVFISCGAATISKLPEWWLFLDKTSYRSHLHRVLFLKSGSFLEHFYKNRALLQKRSTHGGTFRSSQHNIYVCDMTHWQPICMPMAWPIRSPYVRVWLDSVANFVWLFLILLFPVLLQATKGANILIFVLPHQFLGGLCKCTHKYSTHTCTHTLKHTHTQTHTHTHRWSQRDAHRHAHTHTQIHPYTHKYRQTHTQTHTHMFGSIYTDTHKHAREYTKTKMNTHTHTHTLVVIHIDAHKLAHIHTQMHLHTNTNTQTHTHTHTFVSTQRDTRKHANVHTNANTHKRKHTHSHTHRWFHT